MKNKDIQKIVAKTTVIELKPKHKYLFVLDETTGLDDDGILSLMQELKRQGITGIGIYLRGRGGMEVYERKNK